MLIANVLMDEKEGLYINLAAIKNRLHNIEEALEPEEQYEYSAELVNEIDIGTTASFKAWTACYYTQSQEIVGKNTALYVEPEYNYFSKISVAPLEGVATFNNTCASAIIEKTPGVYYGTGNIIATGVLFNYTAAATDIKTVVGNYIDNGGTCVDFLGAWVSDYNQAVSSTCRNTFLPHFRSVQDIVTTKYKRVLDRSLIYYTLDEANTGKQDMSYYLTAPDVSGKYYTLAEANVDTVPFSCRVDSTVAQKDITTLVTRFINYVTPDKLSAIKENTVYLPCISNFTTLGGFLSISAKGSGSTFYGSVCYNSTLISYIGSHPNYYLVSYNNVNYIYVRKSWQLISDHSAWVFNSVSAIGYAYSIQSCVRLGYKLRDKGNVLDSFEYYILEQNQYVSSSEYIAYMENIEDTYGIAIRPSGTETIKRDSYSVALAEKGEDPNYVVVVRSSLKYKGLYDDYTYRNYTFKNLSIKAPTPIYMKGKDGKMYLIAMERKHVGSYDVDDDTGVGTPVYDHFYYGPFYGVIAHKKVSFTPFGLFNRYDTDTWTDSRIGTQGAFIRDTAKDTTATLTGVAVITTEDSDDSFSSYYDSTLVSFGKFTKKATKETATTVIPRITVANLA